MNTPRAYRVPLRLIAFAATLLLVFGVAVAAGSALGPDREPTDTGMAGHGEKPDRVRGLAVADGGLELALDRTELRRGRSAELAFRILEDGRPVRDFDVEHEKRMHVIVVRRDGRGFQHLHPRLGRDGVWRVPLRLPDAGAHRVFADFSHDGEARTLAADMTVDGATDYRPLPAPAASASASAGDGYRVSLQAEDVRAGQDAELHFRVSRDGVAARTEPYLGAGGHLVALREGDLAFLHVHPEGHGETVAFDTAFPSAGRYRLYLQFKHGGVVRRAEFTQEVAR